MPGSTSFSTAGSVEEPPIALTASGTGGDKSSMAPTPALGAVGRGRLALLSSGELFDVCAFEYALVEPMPFQEISSTFKFI